MGKTKHLQKLDNRQVQKGVGKGGQRRLSGREGREGG